MSDSANPDPRVEAVARQLFLLYSTSPLTWITCPEAAREEWRRGSERALAAADAVSPKYEQVGWLNEVGSFIDKTWADTHGKSDVYDSDWDRLYRRLEN